MVYLRKQISHLCFFIVEVAVAGLEGVVFTDTNATSGNQRRAPGLRGLDLVDFNAVRSFPRPWDRQGWHRPVQAEILVPNRIGLQIVPEVCFLSSASMEEAERLWGRTQHPPFRVDPRLFSDWPQAERPIVTFPHLITFLLTDQPADESNADQVTEPQWQFQRRPGTRITAVACVRASAGSKAKLTWNPGGQTEATEFPTSNEYYHWSTIGPEQLQEGICSVEYRLGNVRWATMRFELVR
jgi:hypothetical protein